MPHTRRCPYRGCEWMRSAWFEHNADLEYESHIATCPNSARGPMPADVDSSTFSSILVCRRARYGCTWTISYELGGGETAQRMRIDHEDNVCPFRHLPI